MSEPVIYWGSEAEVAAPLGHWLRHVTPRGGVVALDTETSGLFVDGDYTDAPPARVSVVSLAWEERGDEGWDIVTVALPFDQGRIGGKPGRWDAEADTYERIEHVARCLRANQQELADSDGHTLTCVCAPFNYGADDWAELCAWLRDKKLVMHNAKFDLHIMNAGLRLVPGSGVDLSGQLLWDTMLAQGIIEPLESSSLKPTAAKLWGDSSRDEEQHVKEMLRRNGVGLTWRYDLLEWDVIGPYAGKDTELTLKLFKHQGGLCNEGAVPEVDQGIIRQEISLAKLLFKMECRGVGLDADAMRAEAAKMRAEIARIEKELPFSPANVNAAKRYFFGSTEDGGLGLIPVKTTPKGAPSLDAEVAGRLAQDGVPGADLWVHLSNMNSALSKWYTAWPYKTGPDGRIRTNFRQGRIESDRKGMTSGGAISGRLSAERVQLQGVPKEYMLPEGIRGIKPKKDGTPGLIVAKPGYQLWEVDASNAEVRVAAWLAQCKPLAAVINSGVNIHDGNTRNLFGLEPDHKDWEMMRTVAKTTIFGDLYGAGVRTLKAQVEQATKMEFPEAKIKQFKEALKEAYPELSRTARRCQAKADKGMGGVGWVRLVNGRKRVFGWAERTHKAFNACIQGGVAEMMKVLMLEVEQAHPGILVNQVHDSLWLEVPDIFADLIVAEVQKMGAELFTKTFSTDDVPVRFEFDAKRLA